MQEHTLWILTVAIAFMSATAVFACLVPPILPGILWRGVASMKAYSRALTPPPTGDTPWELALDVIGENLIIIGIIQI